MTLYLYSTHFTCFGPLYFLCVGPAYQGRDFVSRIIIEYECFKHFGPYIVVGCPFFQSHESNFDKSKMRFCTHNLNENTLFILNVISVCTWELGLHAIAQYNELMKKMS
jgi:hypothetical protein